MLTGWGFADIIEPFNKRKERKMSVLFYPDSSEVDPDQNPDPDPAVLPEANRTNIKEDKEMKSKKDSRDDKINMLSKKLSTKNKVITFFIIWIVGSILCGCCWLAAVASAMFYAPAFY